MAKLSNNSRIALCILSLSLLIITIAESRPVLPARIGKQAPACGEVFGVRKGDTCFDIAQKFQLSTPEFDSINPNLDCSALFVGQWLCVYGNA